MTIRKLIAAAVAMIAWTAPAFACSMREGYRVPDNLELVEQADAIMLVRVVGGPTEHGPEPDDFAPELQVELVRALRGSVPPDRLKLFGLTAWNGNPVPAIVTPLSEAHFSTGIGGCIRQFYALGELVVVMFEQGDDGIQPAFHAFARTFETVDGPDDIWVHAVERYLTLADGPEATRRARIEAERARQAALGTIEGAAIAADLEGVLDPGRTLPRDVARSFNAPTETALFLPAPEGDGVALVCTREKPPYLVWQGAPGARLTVAIGDAWFTAAPARTDPSESGAAAVIAALHDPLGALGALRGATGTIAVRKGGQVVASGRAADVALRFAGRCSGFVRNPRAAGDSG
ncbi:hypothetical protein [Sphingomonas japonica]|uniref:Uncharacterized protein n=1 Tax=Sphingomonas japonica TaxID=511662 RepID=A0ABX0U0Z8_9SPHN|nr:hypothetical protein [Sphingomonas japonica]NIJ24245.1 hypothetical protein [Sphingomonas japonica]